MSSTARSRELGHLCPSRSVLLVCDFQERFAPSIRHFWTTVKNTERLCRTAKLLEMPIIATEQYPKVR